MVVPSLVYETNFPRIKRIRWKLLFKFCCHFAVAAIVEYTILVEYVIPMWYEAKSIRFLRSVIRLSLPSMSLWMLNFYIVFHCILNIVAEVTLYADREFYQDWWNAERFDIWWRKWNRPVYKWTVRHLFKDSMHFAKASRSVAMFVTFLVSAILHEFVLSFTLKTFIPFLSFLMLIQMIVIWLTNLPQLKDTQLGNLIMWFSIFCGLAIVQLIYVYSYFDLIGFF